MAMERLVVREIREVLRLRWSLGRSTRQAASSLGVSVGVVAKTTERARKAGLDWAAVEGLDDATLERRLYGEPTKPGAKRPEPDPAWMHQQLRRRDVTLELLHLEYLEEHPTGLQYTAFCDGSRAWKKRLGLTMRQEHKAGERMLVDFSGRRPRIVDERSGGLERSSSSWPSSARRATRTRRRPHRSSSLRGPLHIRTRWVLRRCRSICTGSLKSAVSGSDKHDPTIQRTYRDQARHYGAIVIPARPYRPRDKAKVEVAVQVAQRWILARIQNETFFSLEALNVRIGELLEQLNDRPRKHLGGVSRRELFERIDRPALKPLPAIRFAHHDWKTAKVNLDYHVEIDRHWYSVPHVLVRETVEACFTTMTVELFHRGRRVASHLRSHTACGHTTDPSHRPPNHQASADRDPGGLLRWAVETGPSTEAMMRRIFESNPHRDQSGAPDVRFVVSARSTVRNRPRSRANALCDSVRARTNRSRGCSSSSSISALIPTTTRPPSNRSVTTRSVGLATT